MQIDRLGEQDVLLTLREAAVQLRVSKSAMLRLLTSGQPVGYRVGRGWRIYNTDLHAFIAAQGRRGARTPTAASPQGPALQHSD